MNSDINAWDTIAYYLTARNMRQGDLAAGLEVTSSAVSQMKHGRIVMNPAQIAATVALLAIPPDAQTRWYRQICNARLLTPPPEPERLPVGENTSLPLSALDEYAPAIESVNDYLIRTGRGRCRDGVLALAPDGSYLRSGEFADGGRFRIDCESYPRSGETVLAALFDGRRLKRKYLPHPGGIIFRRPDGSAADCECRATEICWMKRLRE